MSNQEKLKNKPMDTIKSRTRKIIKINYGSVLVVLKSGTVVPGLRWYTAECLTAAMQCYGSVEITATTTVTHSHHERFNQRGEQIRQLNTI